MAVVLGRRPGGAGGGGSPTAVQVVRVGGVMPVPPALVFPWYQDGDGNVVSEVAVQLVPFPPDATELTYTNLEFVAGIGGAGFTSPPGATTVLAFPALVACGGNIVSMASLTTLDLGALVTCGGNIGDMASLTTLDLGALVTCGGSIGGMASLTTLDLGALVTCGGSIDDMASLTTLDVSGLLSLSGDVNFNGGALNQTSVDDLLVKLASLDGTGGTTSYDGHTVDLSGGTNAAPTAPGLAAKTTLEGRGNTVNVNP